MHDAVESTAFLREQAGLCARLANDLDDEEAAAALRNMAMMYEIIARRLDERDLNGKAHPKMEQPPAT